MPTAILIRSGPLSSAIVLRSLLAALRGFSRSQLTNIARVSGHIGCRFPAASPSVPLCGRYLLNGPTGQRHPRFPQGVSRTDAGLAKASSSYSFPEAQSSAVAAAAMEQVVRSTFEQVFPAVQAAVRACDFVAIDAEFTGLSPETNGAAAPVAKRLEVLDDPQQRYARVKAAAESFLILQMGLSAVRWDTAQGCFLAESFSFYLFPRPYKSYDRRFLSQASSLAFLAEHKFDFNKAIYQGVPFLSLEQLRKERRLLENGFKRQEKQQQQQRGQGNGSAAQAPEQQPKRRQQQQGQQGQGVVLVSPGDRLFLGQQMGRVREWVRGTVAPACAPRWLPEGPQGQGVCVLLLEPCKAHVRAALYQQLAAEFGGGEFFAETVEGRWERGVAALRLTRATEAQVQEMVQQRQEAQRAELEAAGGFARVAELLIECRKPLVGHNCLLDFAYFIHHFVRPLPDSLNEFRSQLVEAFPGGIYDTKHLATCSVAAASLFVDGTSLGTLFRQFSLEEGEEEEEEEDEEEEEGDGRTLAAAAAAGTSMRAELSGPGPGALAPGGGAVLDVPLSLMRQEGEGTAVSEKVGQEANSGAEEMEGGMRVELPVVRPWRGCRGDTAPPPAEGVGGTLRPSGAVGNAHDAGYDAFMTATVFASLCTLLPRLAQAPSASDAPEPRTGHDTVINAEVQRHAGRIHVMHSDLPFLPLLGDIPLPDRSGVFLLSNFPPDVNTAALIHLFSSSGLGRVTVIWVDSTSAFVRLEDPSLAPAVPPALAAAAESFPMSLTPWAQLDRSTFDPAAADPLAGMGNASTGQLGLGRAATARRPAAALAEGGVRGEADDGRVPKAPRTEVQGGGSERGGCKVM